MRGRLSTQRLTAWSTCSEYKHTDTKSNESATDPHRRQLVDVASLKAGLALMGKSKSITINDAVLAAFASAIGELGSEADERDRAVGSTPAAAAAAANTAASIASGSGVEKGVGGEATTSSGASTSSTSSSISLPQGSPQLVTAIVPVNLRPLLAVLSGRLPDPNAPLSTQVQAMQGNKIGALLFDLPTAVKQSSSTSTSSSSEVASLAPLVSEVSRRIGWYA
jgi:hypothetical protein